MRIREKMGVIMMYSNLLLVLCILKKYKRIANKISQMKNKISFRMIENFDSFLKESKDNLICTNQ